MTIAELLEGDVVQPSDESRMDPQTLALAVRAMAELTDVDAVILTLARMNEIDDREDAVVLIPAMRPYLPADLYRSLCDTYRERERVIYGDDWIQKSEAAWKQVSERQGNG